MFAAFGFVPSGLPKKAVIRQGIVDAYASDAALSIGLGRANIGRIRERIGGNVFVQNTCFADLTLRSSADGTSYEFRNGILTDAIAGVLAPPPMLSFTRDKNIITTAIDGSDAVIVESFGVKPWTITIDGILVDLENHHYPGSKMRQLRELFEANTTFEVWDCDILADLGIEQVYFEDIKELKVLEDYQDTVKYKLTACSIKPVEFFI
jgi:hypothetical protein